MTNSTPNGDPKTWKINPKKILTVKSEINSVEREAQILNFPKNVKKFLKNLKVENSIFKIIMILLQKNN